MSKIKNGGLDQYGTGPFEQQQFGTAGVEGVNRHTAVASIYKALIGISFHVPRYRNTGSRHYDQLRPNVTSSIKPEVHNVSQRHQKMTEPRPHGIRTTIS